VRLSGLDHLTVVTRRRLHPVRSPGSSPTLRPAAPTQPRHGLLRIPPGRQRRRADRGTPGCRRPGGSWRQTSLTEAGCIQFLPDKLSGKTTDQPELTAYLDYLRGAVDASGVNKRSAVR
jgi:hypothetical protein